VQATGPSMLPTLNAAHDWLVVEKVSVWRNRIEVGAAPTHAQHLHLHSTAVLTQNQAPGPPSGACTADQQGPFPALLTESHQAPLRRRRRGARAEPAEPDAAHHQARAGDGRRHCQSRVVQQAGRFDSAHGALSPVPGHLLHSC